MPKRARYNSYASSSTLAMQPIVSHTLSQQDEGYNPMIRLNDLNDESFNNVLKFLNYREVARIISTSFGVNDFALLGYNRNFLALKRLIYLKIFLGALKTNSLALATQTIVDYINENIKDARKSSNGKILKWPFYWVVPYVKKLLDYASTKLVITSLHEDLVDSIGDDDIKRGLPIYLLVRYTCARASDAIQSMTVDELFLEIDRIDNWYDEKKLVNLFFSSLDPITISTLFNRLETGIVDNPRMRRAIFNFINSTELKSRSEILENTSSQVGSIYLKTHCEYNKRVVRMLSDDKIINILNWMIDEWSLNHIETPYQIIQSLDRENAKKIVSQLILNMRTPTGDEGAVDNSIRNYIERMIKEFNLAFSRGIFISKMMLFIAATEEMTFLDAKKCVAKLYWILYRNHGNLSDIIEHIRNEPQLSRIIIPMMKRKRSWVSTIEEPSACRRCIA